VGGSGCVGKQGLEAAVRSGGGSKFWRKRQGLQVAAVAVAAARKVRRWQQGLKVPEVLVVQRVEGNVETHVKIYHGKS
jgi:hypothetical protein